jgi:hypothetical protein
MRRGLIDRRPRYGIVRPDAGAQSRSAPGIIVEGVWNGARYPMRIQRIDGDVANTFCGDGHTIVARRRQCAKSRDGIGRPF